MKRLLRWSWLPASAACGVLLAACADTAPPPTAAFAGQPRADHVGCPAAKKFTGGGRVDPGPAWATMTGKVTFGFNIHADDDCEALKGQLQVVHHPTQTKLHAVNIRRFASWMAEDGGECGEFTGTVRVKHKEAPWHEHDFEVQFCDYGEPGSSRAGGRDLWRFQVQTTTPPATATRRGCC